MIELLLKKAGKMDTFGIMGIEAYLFNIEFKQAVAEKDLTDLFSEIGMSLIDKVQRPGSEYRSYYFELRTDKGLTEVHCLLSPSDTTLNDFSLRFSILSPKTVIDQTFDLLKKLNSVKPIIVSDPEIRNHIYRQLRKDKKVDKNFEGLNEEEEAKIDEMSIIEIDSEEFKLNKPGVQKREIVINNEEGAIIESGAASFDYIEKKGMFNRFIGWIKKEL